MSRFFICEHNVPDIDQSCPVCYGDDVLPDEVPIPWQGPNEAEWLERIAAPATPIRETLPWIKSTKVDHESERLPLPRLPLLPPSGS